MKQRSSMAVTLLPLLANAAALHTVLVLFAFRDTPIADHRGMLLWWGAMAICHMVLSLFLQKPRELRSVILLGALLLVGQLGVNVMLNQIYPNVTVWAAMICMWIYGYYQCAMGLLNGVKPEALTVTFEIASALLLVIGAVSSVGAMPMGTVAHLAIGVLCALIALMRLRTLHTRMDDSEKRSVVGLFVPLILLGAAGCAVLFCIIISGHAAQLLTRLTQFLGQGLRTIVNGIGAFIFWLFSLLPEIEDPTGGEGFAPDALPSGTPEMDYQSNGVLLYILIAAVILALAVLVFKIWRKVQVQGSNRKRVVFRPVVVKNSGLWAIIRKLLQKLCCRVGFEIRYLQSYHTLSGLLVWLERRMKRRGIKRKTGETTSSYLLRVGEKFPRGREVLSELGMCLDRYYFGDSAELPKEEVRVMRNALRKIDRS